jgi:hypothetical protein
MSSKNEFDQTSDDVPSCIDTVSRKDFLSKVLKGSVLAGSAVTGVKILDRFMIPPAYASGSVNCASNADGSSGDTNGNCDIPTINAGGDYATIGACATETWQGTTPSPVPCYIAYYTGASMGGPFGLETLCGSEAYPVPLGCFVTG